MGKLIETVNNSTGIFMGFSDDYLLGALEIYDFPDNFLVPVIEKYVNKDSIVIDVGANLGYVSVSLSKRCKRVLSIEPQKVVYLNLCANLFLNQSWNVTPVNLACHSYTCFMDFSSVQSDWVGTSNPNDLESIKSFAAISLSDKKNGNIRAKRLDEIASEYNFSEPIDFVKIDAQGGDIDTIMGMSGILDKQLEMNNLPVIVFEYEEDMSFRNYGRKLSDLITFLSKYNYRFERFFGENYLLLPPNK